MKKLLLLSITLLFPLILRSQVCVTLFQGPDFGLDDQYNNIVDIETDRLGNIWFVLYYLSIATFSEVGKFDGAAVWTKVDTAFLPEQSPLDLAIDQKDSVWIATKQGIGIVDINTLEGRTMTPENSALPEPSVTAVAVDSNNTKWIGFSSGSVASYDGVSFKVYKDWSNGPVRVIEVAADSTVWVGLSGSPGIVRFKDGKWTPDATVKGVSYITADKWGRVMAASGDSMVIFTGDQSTSVHSESGSLIQDIAVGQAGRIWACTSGALLLRSGSIFVPYSSKNSAVPAQLSGPIKFDRENRLWFGYKYGLDVLTAAGYVSREAPQVTAVITADKPSLVFCYGDSLTLTAEQDKLSYVWPDGSNTDSYRLYDAATVEVAVEGENRCFYYDTVKVNVQKVYEEEKICAVSVDTSQRNIVIWEKTPAVGTYSYNIYRESAVKDSFVWIANLPVDDLSVFEDPDTSTIRHSVRYKISCVDTCGNESGESFYHETLHLSISQGKMPGQVNLSWNHYQGISFNSYLIYKGPTMDNMYVIDTLSSGLDPSYTDFNVFDTTYYLIAIPLPEECTPTEKLKKGTGPYTHALSNLEDNKKLLTFVGEQPAALEIRTYPNPFIEQTRIEFPDPGAAGYVLRIYSTGGQLVRETRGISGHEFLIQRGALVPGYYMFELRGVKTFRGRFVIR